jgi:hypothetical protein
MTPYNNQNQNQDVGNAANDPMAYHPDNRIPPGRDLHGWVTSTVRFWLHFRRFKFPSFPPTLLSLFLLKTAIGGSAWGRDQLRTHSWRS